MKPHPQRLVYGVAEFKDWEMEHMEKFEEYLAENGINYEQDADMRKKLRFLHGYKFDYAKTVEALNTQIAWEKEHIPAKLSTYSQRIMESGCVYLHGRDIHHRPIIVLDANKIINLKLEKEGLDQDQIGEEVKTLMVFVMEYMRNNLHCPGHIENFIMIIDLNDVGITQCPFTVLKVVLACLQSNYRCMCRKIFVLNACWSIRAGWKAVDLVLSESTRNKITLTSSGTDKELQKMVAPWNLDSRYGGTASEPTEFWPPIMPSDTD